MDLQEDFLNMQIAYEKNCAVRCNCSYEELKAQLDKSESLFGTRYLEGSPRHENWLLWVQAWQAAKAKAVPEGFAFKDVMEERQRQINQEFYSTENDDEYKQNELLRAAVCYAENVVRRGWVFDSNFGPDVYQEEEVPDLWPWDLDFWKPKNPRRDLVRAAALLIAEIERIDRSTGASQ